MTGVSSTGPDTRAVSGFNPDRDGICGHVAPAVLKGIAQPVCGLRWGHRGWHEAEDGSKWSREATGTAAGSAVSGLSGSRRDESGAESGQDGSGHLRARRHLAALIAGTPGVWSTPTRTDADAIAAAVLAAGYRLVAEDDTTVERVIIVLHAEWCGCDEVEAHHDGYRHALDDAARAAVRAVRGDQP